MTHFCFVNLLINNGHGPILQRYPHGLRFLKYWYLECWPTPCLSQMLGSPIHRPRAFFVTLLNIMKSTMSCMFCYYPYIAVSRLSPRGPASVGGGRQEDEGILLTPQEKGKPLWRINAHVHVHVHAWPVLVHVSQWVYTFLHILHYTYECDYVKFHLAATVAKL